MRIGSFCITILLAMTKTAMRVPGGMSSSSEGDIAEAESEDLLRESELELDAGMGVRSFWMIQLARQRTNAGRTARCAGA